MISDTSLIELKAIFEQGLGIAPKISMGTDGFIKADYVPNAEVKVRQFVITDPDLMEVTAKLPDEDEARVYEVRRLK